MLRIGIAGCGRAARAHLDPWLRGGEVRVVGCADPDPQAARDLADQVAAHGPVPTFADHRELLAHAAPQALAICTPHRFHYRLAMDALQAGRHVFIEKPLSTNVQEAVDIVGLARARDRKVGVGHQYRLRPSLVAARRLLAEGAIGPLHLVTATLAAPWLAAHQGPADSWRLDPRVAGGGLLADEGDHLVDALLWATGQPAVEVAAFQRRLDSGIDTVTAAAIRLADGTPATLALSGICPGWTFELTAYGERGRLRAEDATLSLEAPGQPPRPVPLPPEDQTIEANFVSAVVRGDPLSCPAEQAVDTVRLLEAIARSAATAQVVRLA